MIVYTVMSFQSFSTNVTTQYTVPIVDPSVKQYRFNFKKESDDVWFKWTSVGTGQSFESAQVCHAFYKILSDYL